jgi:hypothetical protein
MYMTSALSPNRLVTLPPGLYKARQGPLPLSYASHPINPELRSIQDVGYYAPRGPNLSKLCATCLFFRVTDLAEDTFIYLGYSPWYVAGLKH